MIHTLTATIGLATAFMVLFGIAETLHAKYQINTEHTRKLVHMGSGLLALSFPLLLVSYVPVLVLCSGFTALLLLSKKYRFLNSINAVKRKTRGAELFPLIVFICFLTQLTKGDASYYYLPLLILALADPLAAYFGNKWPIGSYVFNGHKKTLVGSIVFFTTSLLICFTFYSATGLSIENILKPALLISASATTSEGLVKNGYDNVSIPLSVLITLQLTSTAPIC
jgi:dolichol kinase